MKKRKKGVRKEMKKENNKKTWDIISIVVFFLAAYFALNFFEDHIFFHIFGIAFIIAGAYGIISMFKTEKFIFNK